MKTQFSSKVIQLLKAVPYGRVTTYGTIALYADNPQGARQVARILHSSSKKYKLAWHRVVNREGKISLREGAGYERQKELLLEEGVYFDERDRIDFDTFLWWPGQNRDANL